MLKVFNFAVALMLLHRVQSSSPSDSPGVCYTKDCIQTAARMLQNMDPTADPCHNFYDYACGRFSERYLPQNDIIDRLVLMQSCAQPQVKAILEAELDPNEPESFQKVKIFYDSCINSLSVDPGIEPMQDLVKEFGGWPDVEGENWREDQFDWLKTSKKLMSMLGMVTQQSISINLEWEKFGEGMGATYARKPHMKQPMLSHFVSSRQFTWKPMNLTEDDAEYIQDSYAKITKALGASSQLRVEESANEVIQFVSDLLWILQTGIENFHYYERGDEPKENLTIAQLSELIPEVDWVSYFQSAWEGLPEDYIRQTVVTFTQYPSSNFRLLFDFLQSTPKRIHANYLMYSMVKYIKNQLKSSVPLPDLDDSSPQRKEDEAEQILRWRQCLTVTESAFTHIITAMHIEKYYSKGTKAHIEKMFHEMLYHFNETVQTADWVDNETLLILTGQIDKLLIYASHPDELEDTKFLDKAFGHVEIIKNNFFQNMIRMMKYKYDFQTKRILMQRRGWPEVYSLLRVNAYYHPVEHFVQIPSSIIKDMFYLPNRPQFANYASLGYVVGHEMIHAFFRHIFMNEENPNDSESEISPKPIFQDRVKCLLEQYNQHKLFGFRHDPKESLNDDVSDNTGLYLSYKAYQRFTKEHGPEKSLPGISLNLKQQFWLSFGNTWCHAMKRDKAENTVNQNHSPDNIRINNALMNMPQFSEDFNCPLGSTMNPVKKCPIWRTSVYE